MNILLVSSKYMPEYSGSGLRAHNLYKRLLNKSGDINLTVLTGSVSENSCLEYDYDGITVNRIACKPFPILTKGVFRRIQTALNFTAEFFRTLRFLKSRKNTIDLIHIFGKDYVTAAAVHFARRNDIPALIELCNEMDTPFHYIPLPCRLFTSTELPGKYKFVAISQRLKNTCVANNIPEQNIWCRPNPVDEQKFMPVSSKKKHHIRSQMTQFTKEDKLLVYIAKYIPRKNHVFLIDAMKHLPDRYKLFIGGPVAGCGPLAQEGEKIISEIKNKIEVSGLSKRVELKYGFCDNIEQYYQMADLYLFPTKEEGLGTPMLEAIACGIPVVANIIEGITDTWIKNGRNGCLSTLLPEKFASKIRKACDIPRKTILEEAENIIKVAGTAAVDRMYLKNIIEISDRKEI